MVQKKPRNKALRPKAVRPKAPRPKVVRPMAETRKGEHIRICLKKDVGFHSKTAMWEDVELVHRALPELNYSEIDLCCNLFGKKLSAPVVIAGMTGGTSEAAKINVALARAAQKFGIGFGVGSQRPAIENPKLEKTYRVRDVAPDILLLGNLGLVQFVNGFRPEDAAKAVEMIDADALCIHLNAAQEAVQGEGNLNFRGTIPAFYELCKLGFPIVAKETGCGLSAGVARKLVESGASALDVGGAGGTSWVAVEYYRSIGTKQKVAKTFRDWGIPTAASVLACSGLGVPVIATGGVRSGLDAAKAIACGADFVGFALPALKNIESINDYIETFLAELRTAMFLVGARDVLHLQSSAGKILSGKLKNWAVQI